MMIDPNHPFFAKLWRRWFAVLFPLAWGGMELYLGNTGWGAAFLAAGGYAAYVLLLQPKQGD